MTSKTDKGAEVLLPCPFCGEAAIIDETEGSQASGSAVVYRARCERFSCAESPWQSSASEAVQWWNVRSPRLTHTPSTGTGAREAMARGILAAACGCRPDALQPRYKRKIDLKAALSAIESALRSPGMGLMSLEELSGGPWREHEGGYKVTAFFSDPGEGGKFFHALNQRLATLSPATPKETER